MATQMMQGLDMDLIHDKSFYNLGLGQRRGDLKDRFVGKHRGPLRDCKHISGKAEFLEPVQKAV